MGTTIGRLYFYGVAFISLLVAVYGGGSLLATLGKLVLETGEVTRPDISFWRTALSTYIPMLALGGFIWGLHWFTVRNRVARFPEEQQSPLRKLYVNAILTVAAIAALFNAARLMYHLLSIATGTSLPPFEGRGRPQDVYNAAVWLLAYAGIWYYHWQLESEEGQRASSARTLRRWYVYIVSFASLSTLGLGMFLNLSLLLTNIIEGSSLTLAGRSLASLIGNWSLTFAPIIAGAAWWAFHWRYIGKSDAASVLRQVYLYAWIFLGVAGVAGAAGAVLFQLLRFIFGYRAISASVQISFLEYTVPLFLIAGGSLLYHRSAVHEESADIDVPISSVRRRYDYLVSGLGLLALTISLARVLRVLFEAFLVSANEFGLASDWWRDQLSTNLAMTVVGVAVWLPHWRNIEMQVALNESERETRSRRLLLFLVLFAAVITILFNGAFFLNGVLRLALGEPANRPFVSSVLVNLGNVLVVGAFLFYHWQVLQRDRAMITVLPQRRAKALTVLTTEPLLGHVGQVERALGTKVTLLISTRTEEQGQPVENLAPTEVQALVERIQNTPGEKALLIWTSDNVEIHPYR